MKFLAIQSLVAIALLVLLQHGGEANGEPVACKSGNCGGRPSYNSGYPPIGQLPQHPPPVAVLPVPAPHPVPVPVPEPYPVGIPEPYPVGVPEPYPVGVPQPYPVSQPVPVPEPYPVPVSPSPGLFPPGLFPGLLPPGLLPPGLFSGLLPQGGSGFFGETFQNAGEENSIVGNDNVIKTLLDLMANINIPIDIL